MNRAGKVFFLLAILTGVGACSTGPFELSSEPLAAPVKAQSCPANSTPVIDKHYNPLGCYKTNINRVDEGSSCDKFGAGAITIDVKGDMYECE